MHRLLHFFIAIMFFVLISFPLVTSALGLSFGGIITVLTPCISPLGPSIWMTIVPMPATKHPFYIWTPETFGTPPIMGVPPTHPVQSILGVADVPYACAIPYPPWILPGQRIFVEAVSPV